MIEHSTYAYAADQTRWTIRKVAGYDNVVRLNLDNEVVETATNGVGYTKADIGQPDSSCPRHDLEEAPVGTPM